MVQRKRRILLFTKSRAKKRKKEKEVSLSSRPPPPPILTLRRSNTTNIYTSTSASGMKMAKHFSVPVVLLLWAACSICIAKSAPGRPNFPTSYTTSVSQLVEITPWRNITWYDDYLKISPFLLHSISHVTHTNGNRTGLMGQLSSTKI